MPTTSISVAQTLSEHEVLITGANGFVGKVVLALLFDHFPEFKHLHILMRGKRGTSPADRFAKDVLNSPCLQPVVARADPGRVVGYLGRADILAARSRLHEEEELREKGPLLASVRPKRSR